MADRSREIPVSAIISAIVLALCCSGITRADEEAEWFEAFAAGGALYQKGDYQGAARAYQRALELTPRVWAPGHPNTAAILNNLGNVYKDIGQYAQAEPLLQRSLKLRESTLGPDHPEVAASLNNLAIVYWNRGQHTEAEPLLQRSLKIREFQFGPNHPDVAQSLNNLAILYKETGQYAKAEPLYRRSLKIWESTLGFDHPDVTPTLNNLAALYEEMGQFGKAEPLYQRSLRIRESNLAPDHPEVALSLNNLANLYEIIGQYAKAEPLYRRSLTIWESKLGPDHPAVATSLNNLAMLCQLMGQYTQAQPLYQRSLAIRESRLGPAHPDVATSLNNLANLYQAMGQYAEAEPLLQRSLKIWESQFGPDHPDLAISLNNLARLYADMREYGKAESLYQRSFKIRESQLAPEHPDLAESLNNLAALYAATGRWAEAAAETEKERRIIRPHIARVLPILSEKEQLTFLQTQYSGHLHIALSLALNRRSDGQIVSRSAGWVLNGKAVAQEVLAQRSVLAAEGANPALADLVKQLLAVRSQFASLSLAAPKPGQEAAHRRQLDDLNQREQELSRQLGKASRRGTASDPWVEPAAVRKALHKGLLIEIVRFHVFDFAIEGKGERWQSPRYVAWLVPAEGQGEISIIDLGEARPIDDAVQQTRKALENAETTMREEGEPRAERQLRETMREVSRLVFDPLEKHFDGARQLVISPDAALWLVPWGALPLADGSYAIEKYQIHYMISGRDLVSQGADAARKPTDPILFANPDYDLAPAQVEAATRAVLRGAAPVGQSTSTRSAGSMIGLPRVRRLPATAEEAAAIRPNVTRYAGTEPVIYEDQYAAEGVFKAMHRPKVLVLSTHGFFLPDQEVTRSEDRLASEGSQRGTLLTTEGKPLENPLVRCGLLLAGCNQLAESSPAGVDDGVLTGLEIVGTDLRGTELVVLSACETGLGQVRNGEGVAGLRQAFQLAGVRAVVSTLWAPSQLNRNEVEKWSR